MTGSQSTSKRKTTFQWKFFKTSGSIDYDLLEKEKNKKTHQCRNDWNSFLCQPAEVLALVCIANGYKIYNNHFEMINKLAKIGVFFISLNKYFMFAETHI